MNSLSTPYVSPDTPERCADEQANILAEFNKQRLEVELVDGRRQDEACHDLRTPQSATGSV